jgi:hypothetical protein
VTRAGLASRLGRALAAPFARLDRPIFIIGCGRSGTTILGQILSRHPELAYFDERRDLWLAATPAADVWTRQAAERRGQLALDGRLGRGGAGRRLRAAFVAELRRADRPRLLEKLPINAFRVPFIEAACPGARFVHLVRHGIDVALSIAERCRHAAWYGVDDYKWRQLAAWAEARPRTRGLAARCTDDRRRGLLEWRLSVETALEGLAAADRARQLEVRYEELVARPTAVVEAIEAFLELPPAPEVQAFARAQVQPRRFAAIPVDDAALLAGDLLHRLGYEVPG